MIRIDRLLQSGVLLFVLTGASEARAQVFTPTFMAPRSSSDVGVYFSDGPGEFALEGIWRRAQGGHDLGLRAGIADTDDLSILLGAEYRNPVSLGAPLDLAVTGAAQGVLGDLSAFGFLLGLSIGHTIDMDEMALTPYIHPRIGLIEGFGDGELDVEVLADFGIDARLSQNVELRFGVGLDPEAAEWGIGFAWR